jgi:hypothetical protein
MGESRWLVTDRIADSKDPKYRFSDPDPDRAPVSKLAGMIGIPIL